MIRVVVDTNILISALLQPRGFPAQVLLVALEGTTAQLCMSAYNHAEYEEVIRRPRFKRSEREIADTLGAIREMGLWVKPAQKVFACADSDDDIFLECAEAARAHYLVTGNVRHFPARWASTSIVIARQFLSALAEIQEEPR